MSYLVVWVALVSWGGGRPLNQSSQPVSVPPTDARSTQLERLKRCREGLIDPEARPVERRRWAELLFSYDTPEAWALSVALLGDSQKPEVQRTLCRVISDLARQTPARLDASLIDPLMGLLGAPEDDLRAQAAQALADFPGSDVPQKLGALASKPDAPLRKRLAAIDALAPNTHRREVVGQLIRLLDAGVAPITERVVSALEPLSPQKIGNDVAQWRSWWAAESLLSEEAWLAKQVRIDRDRWRQAVDELRRVSKEARDREEALTMRMQSFQRELHRTLTGEPRSTRLVEWLQDPLSEVRRGALAIIKSRIADEGKGPSGEVRTALLPLLHDESPALRRAVLEIVQNLNDPSVVKAVLERLDQETDPVTRYAILQALGKMNSPLALPALLREIASADSPLDCVREAAVALGRVAGQRSAGERLAPETIRAVKERYQTVPGDQPALRAALLAAMAGLADPSFAPEFLNAIESDDPAVLRAAIRGLRVIRDHSKMPRLRTLVAHADPLLRLEAIEAVGELGREEADLERLLTRLSPADEPNERARDAAWRGFCAFLERRPVAERISAAQRLRDTPDLEVRYLEQMAEGLSNGDGESIERETVLDRLATVLDGLGRHAEAVDYLRVLYDLRNTRSCEQAWPDGLRLLRAMLRSAPPPQIAELIQQLATAAKDDPARLEVVDTVAAYLDSEESTLTAERLRLLLDDLRTIPVGALGDPWEQLLEQAGRRLDADDSGTTPDSTPPRP